MTELFKIAAEKLSHPTIESMCILAGPIACLVVAFVMGISKLLKWD